ncbi:phosphatidylglycerophosphatase and protein-tyrosine phosphatase 1-like [Haliotis rubra]|uniref:phosphatidylglycerophosphatase and protein-tyrosine phosphatase 1-like n=1 Tax=Haliotis rubra TaxID=36100 RepID=UPI001EE54CEC|nr:phosphatidylglycerophosphatase and protein-tyrosine phosphatase 1-like [Haliotis rubra]
MAMFTKLAFYPTVGYTLFMAQVTSRKYYNRIDDTVVLGALPIKWILKELVAKENVTALVSVNENFGDLHQYGIEQLQLPTVDYVGTPSQDNIRRAVNFINTYRERKETVYVHCKAGRTRSSTVVACYLMEAYNYTPEQAVDFIKARRKHVWIREKQWNSIRTFYKDMHKDPVSD